MNVNKNVAIGTDVLTPKAPMNSLRKTSFVAGTLYLLTFVSVPTLVLYNQVKAALRDLLHL